MPLLRVHLLGPAQVFWEAQPLRIVRRKVRALLYFLALEGQNRPIARSELIDALWGDDSVDGAKSLREALSRLRRILPDPSVVYFVDREAVHIDAARVWVDAWDFLNTARKLEDQAHRLPEDVPLPAEIALEWQRILDLWQGDEPFQGVDPGPGGEVYDRWMAYWVRMLLRLRYQGYRRLAEFAWDIGDYAQAGRWAVELVKRLPSEGEMVLFALRAFRQAGLLSEARQAWEAIRPYLVREGLPPEVVEEAQRLLDEPTIHSTVRLPKVFRVRPSLRLPFVGRQEVLQKVLQAVRQGRVVILTGEAGQGKTTLLNLLAHHEAERRFVLALTCTHGEQRLPLHPWIEALSEQIPPEMWRSFRHPETLAPLLPLIPALRQYFPHLTPPEFVALEAREGAIHLALQAVLREISTHRPLLLLVDDVQWADRATLQALRFVLTRRPFRYPQAGAVLTFRSEEISSDLQDMLQRLRADVSAVQEPLRPLDEEALRRLGEEALQRPLRSEELSHLARFSGGNPFFALEMLRHWQQLAEQGRDPLAEGSLPDSVTALVEQRLATLPPTARLVLETAALTGYTFSARVLEKALDLTPERLSTELERLVQAHLLVPLEDEGLFRFGHEVVREAVVERLSPTRAWALHRTLAEALEAVWGPRAEVRAAVLAQHYQAAGDAVQAFHWWLRAARHAIRLGDRQAAYQAFAAAERLFQRHEDLFQAEEVWTLYSEWGDLAREVEDTLTVERVGRALIRAGRQLQNLWLQGVGYDSLSEAAVIRSHFHEGAQYAAQAVALLRARGKPFDLMEALVHRGVHEYMQGYLDQAIQTLREALALGEGREDDPLIARALGDALYELGMCLTLAGDVHEAKESAQRAIALYERVERPYGQAGAMALLSFVRYYLGEYRAGEQEALQAAGWLRGLQKWRLLGSAYLYRGMNLLDLGHLGPAWAAAEEAQRIGQTYHHPEIEATALRLKGDMYVALGAFEQAAPLYTLAQEKAQDTFVRFNLLHRLGLMYAWQGDPGGAAMMLGQALAVGLERKGYLLVVPIRVALALLGMYHQNWEMAEEQAQQAYEEARAKSIPIYLAWMHTLLGYLRLLQGKPEEAAALFRESVTGYERIPLFWGTLYALYGLRVLGQWGESEARLLSQLRVEFLRYLTPESRGELPYLKTAYAFLDRLDRGDFGPIPSWTPEWQPPSGEADVSHLHFLPSHEGKEE